MPNPALIKMCEIALYQDGQMQTTTDPLVIETPMTIFVNNREFVTMVCSPHAYEELAVGYLLSEGVLENYSDLKSIHCDEDEQKVWLETSLNTLSQEGSYSRYINTCMGKGRAGIGISPASRSLPTVCFDGKFAATDLLQMISLLDEKSTTFRSTGGVHSAALGYAGELLVRYEDIGRHNAVDKVFGYSFLNHVSMADKCLILSGRVASEILIKAACNGVSLVLSRSAPTAFAVELAQKIGITIVGFARGQRFNVYSNIDRVSV